MGLQRGQGRWSPAALPAMGHKELQLPCLCHCQPPLSSHMCGLLQRKEMSAFLSFCTGKRIAGMQGSPSATGCCQCLIFFAFLLAPWLREVLPASERLPGCAQPCVAAAKSSLLRIPGGMEGDGAKQLSTALLPLGWGRQSCSLPD